MGSDGGSSSVTDLAFSLDNDHIDRTSQGGRVDPTVVVVRPREVLRRGDDKGDGSGQSVGSDVGDERGEHPPAWSTTTRSLARE